MTHDEWFERIWNTLQEIRKQSASQEWYTVKQLAVIVERRPFTVREWCRLGRINAIKTKGKSGPHCLWTIPHSELERFRRDLLLPRRAMRRKEAA